MKGKKVLSVGPLHQKRYGRIHDSKVCGEHWKYQWCCKNHWCQWPETKKHSMVMVSSKNVEIYNGLCKIIDISNVLRKLWNHVIYRIVFDVMVLLITLYFLSCKHAFHCKLNSRTFYCIGFSKPFSSKIWKLSKNHWGQCTVSPKIVLPSFSSKAGSLLQYQCKWK